jgi:hypothetical protein
MPSALLDLPRRRAAGPAAASAASGRRASSPMASGRRQPPARRPGVGRPAGDVPPLTSPRTSKREVSRRAGRPALLRAGDTSGSTRSRFTRWRRSSSGVLEQVLLGGLGRSRGRAPCSIGASALEVMRTEGIPRLGAAPWRPAGGGDTARRSSRRRSPRRARPGRRKRREKTVAVPTPARRAISAHADVEALLGERLRRRPQSTRRRFAAALGHRSGSGRCRDLGHGVTLRPHHDGSARHRCARGRGAQEDQRASTTPATISPALTAKDEAGSPRQSARSAGREGDGRAAEPASDTRTSSEAACRREDLGEPERAAHLLEGVEETQTPGRRPRARYPSSPSSVSAYERAAQIYPPRSTSARGRRGSPG